MNHEEHDGIDDGPGDDAVGDGSLFPIRVVSQRTGVNSVTLRAWERRYGLLKPVRTPKGHRLYGDDDVRRVERIVAWIDRGVSIGQVRALLDRGDDVADALPAGAPGDWPEYASRIARAVAQFDENRLDDVVNEAMALYPFAVVCERLLHPLGDSLAARAAETPGDRAERAFLEGYLERKLSTRLQLAARHLGSAPPVLVAALPGAVDALALLVLAVAFHALERPVVLLPAALPLPDLLLACEKRPPAAIVLHGAQAQEPAALARLLSQLVTGARVPVSVAGPAARIHAALVTDSGAQALADASLATAARRALAAAPGAVA